jgi:hypothetical protein
MGSRAQSLQISSAMECCPELLNEVFSVERAPRAPPLAIRSSQPGLPSNVVALCVEHGKRRVQHRHRISRHARTVLAIVRNDLAMRRDRKLPRHPQVHVVIGRLIH